jgi:DNA repair photolyase
LSLVQTVANKGPLLTKTGFKGYDICFNPYVGCQFGCKYCYVRFFIKDDNEEWGNFVRRREHIADKLPKEINKGFFKRPIGKEKLPDGKKKTIFETIKNEDLRLVIGTMTDPYMPIEKKHRLTRAALKILIKSGYKKIGIFTRSPIVVDDIDLIKQLPDVRVHFSITPYQNDILRLIEPIPVKTSKRFATIKKLKEEGIRIHVNIAPAIPIFSDGLEIEFAQQMAEAGVDEFFVDPMQTYDQSFTATKEALSNEDRWSEVEAIIQNEVKYQEWKNDFKARWSKAWEPYHNDKTLPIWCDHVNHVWKNLITDQNINPRDYC